MNDVAIIDLFSQRVAVKSITIGWTEFEIVDWLKDRGDLLVSSSSRGNIYQFQSKAGIQTTFVFINGQMLFYEGDHSLVE